MAQWRKAGATDCWNNGCRLFQPSLAVSLCLPHHAGRCRRRRCCELWCSAAATGMMPSDRWAFLLLLGSFCM